MLPWLPVAFFACYLESLVLVFVNRSGYIVSLDIKECICNFTNCQIHPFISKETISSYHVRLSCHDFRVFPARTRCRSNAVSMLCQRRRR